MPSRGRPSTYRVASPARRISQKAISAATISAITIVDLAR